jgi:hypothetical protein
MHHYCILRVYEVIGTIDGGIGVVFKLLKLLMVTLKLLMVAMVHTSADKLEHCIICDFYLTPSGVRISLLVSGKVFLYLKTQVS